MTRTEPYKVYPEDTKRIKSEYDIVVYGRGAQARAVDCGEHFSRAEAGSIRWGRRVPATISAIADAVWWAEEIMKVIDQRWPVS